jgi:hypothetical protein
VGLSTRGSSYIISVPMWQMHLWALLNQRGEGRCIAGKLPLAKAAKRWIAQLHKSVCKTTALMAEFLRFPGT